MEKVFRDEGVPTGWGGGNTRGNIKVRRISSLSEYQSLEEALWEKRGKQKELIAAKTLSVLNSFNESSGEKNKQERLERNQRAN